MTTPFNDRHAQITQIADALYAGEASRTPIAPPSLTLPGLSIDEAYEIQATNVTKRLAAGEVRAGHKIGLTSLAMQHQLGVDQPDYGVITDMMVMGNDAKIPTSALIAPRVEAEFAFRIGYDLPASPSLEQLRESIEGVALALEIIDSRVADWKITLVDTIADNASSARIVCGPFAPVTGATLTLLPATVITLTRDSETVAAGPGSAVLGDPLLSLHWLATAIGRFGDRFSAGDIVLAGAVAAALPLVPNAVWRANGTGFGSVTLTSI